MWVLLKYFISSLSSAWGFWYLDQQMQTSAARGRRPSGFGRFGLWQCGVQSWEGQDSYRNVRFHLGRVLQSLRFGLHSQRQQARPASPTQGTAAGPSGETELGPRPLSMLLCQAQPHRWAPVFSCLKQLKCGHLDLGEVRWLFTDQCPPEKHIPELPLLTSPRSASCAAPPWGGLLQKPPLAPSSSLLPCLAALCSWTHQPVCLPCGRLRSR